MSGADMLGAAGDHANQPALLVFLAILMLRAAAVLLMASPVAIAVGLLRLWAGT